MKTLLYPVGSLILPLLLFAASASGQSTINATSKFAYGANTGWINLGTGDLDTDTMACPDTNTDNISDAWEFQKFGNLSLAGIGTDKDGDGQTDAADTDPNSAGDHLRIVSQTCTGSLPHHQEEC